MTTSTTEIRLALRAGDNYADLDARRLRVYQEATKEEPVFEEARRHRNILVKLIKTNHFKRRSEKRKCH